MRGFSIAELLITMMIVAQIATFTIPKLLQAQQGVKDKAKAKEVASMLAGAYEQYKRSNIPNSSTKWTDLTPFMNFVSRDTSSTIDDAPTYTSINCSSGTIHCWKMHNGGTFYYVAAGKFGGSGATNALIAGYDLEPGYSVGVKPAVDFVLYFNGRLTSLAKVVPGTYYNGTQFTTDPNKDPSWFDW